MCLTAEARLQGDAEHVHMVHERDCGWMGHISYRFGPQNGNPPRSKTAKQESPSQYYGCWTCGTRPYPLIWQVHLLIIRPFRDHRRNLKLSCIFFYIEKHIYVTVMRILWKLIRFIETKTRSKILYNTSQKNTRINFNVWDTCRLKSTPCYCCLLSP